MLGIIPAPSYVSNEQKVKKAQTLRIKLKMIKGNEEGAEEEGVEEEVAEEEQEEEEQADEKGRSSFIACFLRK